MNGILNDNNRILELCFISSEMVHNTSVTQAPTPLVKLCRHHPPLQVFLLVSPPLAFTPIAESFYYDYRRANFLAMNRFFLAINWNEVLDNKDIDEATASMSNVLLYEINQFVPKGKTINPHYPPWSNKNLKRLKSVKRFNLKKFSKHRSDFWKNRYAASNKNYK